MIQEKSYYIIKVETKSGCYYKIGEGYKISRPNILIEKYNKLRANKAELLTFETLPHNSKKRLNDKTIHAKIDSAKMKKADHIYIEHYLGETDGKEEFFELVDKSLDVVEYIRAIISSCNSKDYTASVKEIIDLDFKDKYHLVNNEIIEKIEKKFPEVDDILFNLQADNVLLIGQFEPDFVASFAMHNNVIIWHDTIEQRHTFTYSKLNNNIKYFEETLEEFIEEIKDMNIDLIIANPPYGKVGANITKEIIDNVDFKEYINLLPLKDYKHSLDIANHINYDSITIMPPFAFGDADTITAACSISKQAINNIKSIREFVSNTYVVDEPMSKFMKANCVRTDSVIDNLITYKPDIDVTTSVAFHCFMIGSNHNSGWPAITSNCTANKYNFNNEVADEINKKSGGSNFRCIKFNTSDEKINFMNFVKNNFSFCNRLQLNNMLSGRDDSSCFIKVDWTRSDWTVEKILKEVAFYTDEEIKAVLDSDDTLHNYCGDVKFLHDQFPNHF